MLIGLITMPRGRTAPPLLLVALFFGLTRGELPEYPLTFNQMKILAGYYTNEGRYRGGIPEAKGVYRSTFSCNTSNVYVPTNTAAVASNTITTANASACMEWNGYSLDEHCECIALATNEEYCSDWECSLATHMKVCDHRCEFNVYVTSDKVCQCDIENNSSAGSEGGRFCDAWSCFQKNSIDRTEFQEFDCKRVSPSGRFCEAWNGHVTATMSIQVVACECTADLDGDGSVCASWECGTTKLTKCASYGLSWCSLRVSVGVGGGIGMLGVILVCSGVELTITSYKGMNLGGFIAFYGLGLLWCCMWSAGVLVWGGVDGAIYVGIMWGGSVGLTVVRACLQLREVIKKSRKLKVQVRPQALAVDNESPVDKIEAIGDDA